MIVIYLPAIPVIWKATKMVAVILGPIILEVGFRELMYFSAGRIKNEHIRRIVRRTQGRLNFHGNN